MKRFLTIGILIVLISTIGITLYKYSTTTETSPSTSSPPTRSATKTVPQGRGTWLLYCKKGWEAFQKDSTYTDFQGNKKQKDLYLYGDFWVNTITSKGETLGELYEYPEKEKHDCLSNAVKTVHANGGKVYGVIAIDMDAGNATKEDVVQYFRKASQSNDILMPLVNKVEDKHYDGLINDIETGDENDPGAFTQFNTNLKKLLHERNKDYKLGIALDAKQPAEQKQWQDWTTLSATADFFIVMALDHYQSSTTKPFAITDAVWIKELADLVKKDFPAETVMWELPKYCRVWKQNTQTKIWETQIEKDGGSCNYKHVQAHLKEFKALPAANIVEDKSNDPQNPYISYIDNDGNNTMIYFETPESLEYLSTTIQTAMPTSCIRLSFWDYDSGELDTSFLDKKVKIC